MTTFKIKNWEKPRLHKDTKQAEIKNKITVKSLASIYSISPNYKKHKPVGSRNT